MSLIVATFKFKDFQGIQRPPRTLVNVKISKIIQSVLGQYLKSLRYIVNRLDRKNKLNRVNRLNRKNRLNRSESFDCPRNTVASFQRSTS